MDAVRSYELYPSLNNLSFFVFHHA